MKRFALIASMFLACSSLLAQLPPRPDPPPAEDVIGNQLFPPDLIMRNQESLHLTDAQRSAIRSEVVKLQTHVVDLQFQLSDEAERLATLLRATPVDEAKALEQADKVMSLERNVKRLHLGTLVRIKNTLNRDQIAMLQEMRQHAYRP